MKKSIAIIFLMLVCTLFATVEASASEQMAASLKEIKTDPSEQMTASLHAMGGDSSAAGWTPLRIAVWPDTVIFPHNMNVYGLSLGFPISFDDQPNLFVAGLDLALLNANSKFKGLQMSIENMGKESDGAQIGIVNIYADDFAGAQIGVYNDYKNSSGFQLGLANISTNSNGVQFGLINFMDNGILKFFPFFNFPLEINPQKGQDGLKENNVEVKKSL